VKLLSTNIDPFTYEVLRHRFSAIVEEGAITLRNVSGSPTVAHSNDCNVVLLDAQGQGVLIGYTLPTHAYSCINLVKYVLEEFVENPGIRAGDMFLSNDPYICTPHQNCVVMAAPIFHEGRLIAWAAAGIHMADVGGPVAGQVSVGAQSIYEEATSMPPIKMVENGVLRKDLENDFLSRSRTPAQNTLDMRAMMSACYTMTERFLGSLERYGEGSVKEAMSRILDLTEDRLRSVLSDIPDNTWGHTLYMDYNDRGSTTFYACVVKMTKTGDTLTFDFRGSSPQAPAVVNCTYPALVTSVILPIVAMFGFAIPLCPGAILRVIRIISEPGTAVHCAWPAGVSKGTTAMSQTIRHAVTLCLSKMFATHPDYHSHVLAVCNGQGSATQELIGTDQRGDPFAGVFSMYVAGGYGARANEDGVNTGGMIGGPEISIPNVETNEFYFPLLYLYRREEPDTAGPGAYRGGAGIGVCFTLHDVEGIPNNTIHSLGVEVPTAYSLFGGYPGSTVKFQIKRQTNVTQLFHRGVLPTSLEEIEGQVEHPPSVCVSYLGSGDVWACDSCGGGGFGDPLLRDPEKVMDDIRSGFVSSRQAADMYGVLFDEVAEQVDVEATSERRQTIQQERRANARAPAKTLAPMNLVGVEEIGWVNPHLRLVQSQDRDYVRCMCGHLLCPGPEDQREYMALGEKPCSTYPMYAGSDPRFIFKEWYCPACWTLLDLEVSESVLTNQENE